MKEYGLIQEKPGGAKIILATYTPKHKTIAQETAEAFSSIKDGCRYYLKEWTIQSTICLLCGQDMYSSKEEYEEKLRRAREAIKEIIWKKYKDSEADTVARGIMLAIEEA